MTEITIKQILPNITTYKYVSKKSIQINKLCMYDATSVIYQMTISEEKEKKIRKPKYKTHFMPNQMA